MYLPYRNTSTFDTFRLLFLARPRTSITELSYDQLWLQLIIEMDGVKTSAIQLLKI